MGLFLISCFNFNKKYIQLLFIRIVDVMKNRNVLLILSILLFALLFVLIHDVFFNWYVTNNFVRYDLSWGITVDFGFWIALFIVSLYNVSQIWKYHKARNILGLFLIIILSWFILSYYKIYPYRMLLFIVAFILSFVLSTRFISIMIWIKNKEDLTKNTKQD